ncbi:MAG: VOC family protein [Hyphomicrobiaceae bacterium]
MRLGYVILYVPDVARTVAFYEAAFGLTRRFVHDSGTYAEMETGATALAFAAESLSDSSGLVFARNRPDGLAAGAEVGLVTDDVAGRYQTAIDAGAVAVTPPTRKPWGQTVSYVRDLNGFLVEICSPVRG